MMKTEAEEELDAAQETVNQWLENCGCIETKLLGARSDLAAHEAERTKHALGATLGDAEASSAARRAKEGYLAALADIDDLQEALSQGKAKLGEMQAIAVGAARERAKELAAAVIKRRIECAARFDAAAEAMQQAYTEFGDIADELAIIPNFDGYGTGPSATSRAEMVKGSHRIAAALPPLVDGLEIKFRGLHGKLA